jgi:cobalt-zinc-cadmium efflux system outer membrane protein
MKHNTARLSGFVCVLLFLAVFHGKAQDTMRTTLPEAEKQFIEKNLSLLAEKYNIDIVKAALIQSKLYDNPTFSFNGGLYNPEQKKIIDISHKTGQYEIGVQKLIRLAGKRNKEIKLAETNTALSENQFLELMRTLRFSLRSNFFNAYFLQNSIRAYHTQIISLENLNSAYQDLQTKGVVTLKDALRIKSLLYSLKAEQASLQNQLNDLQAELQLLLQNNQTYFLAETNAENEVSRLTQYTLQSLVDTAYANRNDLKFSENNLTFSTQNFALQKALAVPDLTLGASFDRRSSFVDNAMLFSVSMDLPFFNRNQGNIKAAKIGIDQSKTVFQQQKLTVENEVQRAYIKVLNTEKVLQSIDPDFKNEFEKLLLGITQNFKNRNISLIEFTDFNESYKDNILQFNQLQNERMQAIEALNFSVGKTLFNN